MSKSYNNYNGEKYKHKYTNPHIQTLTPLAVHASYLSF